MGHERTGTLPKSQRWRDIVQQIATFHESDAAISNITIRTIENVRARFKQIQRDGGVRAAFEFLVAVSGSSRSPSIEGEWQTHGLKLPAKRTPLAVVQSLQDWVRSNQDSTEYAGLAQAAASDAIVAWFAENKTGQGLLFEPSEEPSEIWRRAASGAGFCELSRLFFSKFTERYLNYFLEREASAVLPDVGKRNEFETQLRKHVESVSKHAFETAKITQSFAAGWFNKNATDAVPTREQFDGFLALAFGKLREELLRERDK
jgi:hypothetical protein